MPDDSRENDFERESLRLSEGLKSCRAMIDSYRTMMAESQNGTENDLSRYVPAAAAGSAGHQGDSAAS